MKVAGAEEKHQKGRWTIPEHNRFLKGLEKYGKNWTEVQKKVKTRTTEQVRSHAQKVFFSMSKTDVNAMFELEKEDLPKDKAYKKGKSLPRRNGKTQKTSQKDLKKSEEEKNSVIQPLKTKSSPQKIKVAECQSPKNERKEVMEYCQFQPYQWSISPFFFYNPSYIYPGYPYYGEMLMENRPIETIKLEKSKEEEEKN